MGVALTVDPRAFSAPELVALLDGDEPAYRRMLLAIARAHRSSW